MRPSLRQLEYAVAVAEHLSFQKAAQSCHVSQPGLSTQLRQLEDTLGVRLFERDRRHVRLTEAGAAIVERAERILVETDELIAEAQIRSEPFTGTLRLGVIPTIAPYVLPAALRKIRRAYPKLRVLLHEAQTSELVEALDSGDLDVLLLALEADLGSAVTLELFRDEFVVAMARKHPMSAHKTIKETDLRTDEILLLDDGHCLRDQSLQICSRARANEVGDFRAGSLPTLTQMVASGVGLTLLPAMSLEIEAGRSSGITTRPFRSPQPFRTIGLAWRPSSPRAEEFEALSELFTG